MIGGSDCGIFLREVMCSLSVETRRLAAQILKFGRNERRIL